MILCEHYIPLGATCLACNPPDYLRMSSTLDSRIENMQTRLNDMQEEQGEWKHKINAEIVLANQRLCSLEDSKGYAGTIERQLAHVDNVLSKRIEALEKNANGTFAKHVQNKMRIEELEDFNVRQIEWNQHINNRLEEVEISKIELETHIEDLRKERDLGVERIKKLEEARKYDIDRIEKLERQHVFQIDENREISRIVNALETKVGMYKYEVAPDISECQKKEGLTFEEALSYLKNNKRITRRIYARAITIEREHIDMKDGYFSCEDVFANDWMVLDD